MRTCLPPVLLLCTLSSGAHAMTEPVIENARPAHDRCALVRVGMSYRDALATMGRDPDSTLSGHAEAGPDGQPPAGSYAIDAWNSVDARNRPLISSIRSSGGVVEEVVCGRPAPTPAPAPLSSGL